MLEGTVRYFDRAISFRVCNLALIVWLISSLGMHVEHMFVVLANDPATWNLGNWNNLLGRGFLGWTSRGRFGTISGSV